eukprot:200286_1
MMINCISMIHTEIKNDFVQWIIILLSLFFGISHATITSFGFHVSNTKYSNDDPMSNNIVRTTLYWENEILECNLVPNQNSTWALCNTTSPYFIDCQHISSIFEYKMNLKLMGND